MGCKDGCEWDAYCSKLPNEESLQVRKVNDKHNCSIEYNVKMMSTQ